MGGFMLGGATNTGRWATGPPRNGSLQLCWRGPRKSRQSRLERITVWLLPRMAGSGRGGAIPAGHLGDGTTTQRNASILLTSSSGIAGISAGYGPHSGHEAGWHGVDLGQWPEDSGSGRRAERRCRRTLGATLSRLRGSDGRFRSGVGHQHQRFVWRRHRPAIGDSRGGFRSRWRNAHQWK